MATGALPFPGETSGLICKAILDSHPATRDSVQSRRPTEAPGSH